MWPQPENIRVIADRFGRADDFGLSGWGLEQH